MCRMTTSPHESSEARSADARCLQYTWIAKGTEERSWKARIPVLYGPCGACDRRSSGGPVAV